MDDEDDDVKPRPLQEMLNDTTRIAYYEGYLSSVLQAMRCHAELTSKLDLDIKLYCHERERSLSAFRVV